MLDEFAKAYKWLNKPIGNVENALKKCAHHFCFYQSCEIFSREHWHLIVMGKREPFISDTITREIFCNESEMYLQTNFDGDTQNYTVRYAPTFKSFQDAFGIIHQLAFAKEEERIEMGKRLEFIENELILE
jgi:hypothetical protein